LSERTSDLRIYIGTGNIIVMVRIFFLMLS